MGTGQLTVDLSAVQDNWRALDQASGVGVETGAVVKANGYGLGVEQVARALATAGARHFFVAEANEGKAVRRALGPRPKISIFSGHMDGDTQLIKDFDLTPMLNSHDQLWRHIQAGTGLPFGIQLDTGMNRLGIEPSEWAAMRSTALPSVPTLIMSHLACADEPDHEMNRAQLIRFKEMTDGLKVPRSLSATGGTLLGPDYHFDLTRPGIGLYGGLPFAEARPVARLSLPIIQVRNLAPGETVGYGNTWTADGPRRIATVSAGYADGLIRAMGGKAMLYSGDTPCPLAGRVSMDLLTVDITVLRRVPETLDILSDAQTVDALADAAGTIGYEILTSLGPRYARRYVEGHA